MCSYVSKVVKKTVVGCPAFLEVGYIDLIIRDLL